jgi:hypothetical protein
MSRGRRDGDKADDGACETDGEHQVKVISYCMDGGPQFIYFYYTEDV